MTDAYCVQHFDRKAVGNCAACGKPFCAECLDVETAQPVCPNCRQLKAKEALKASLGGTVPGGSPLQFKGVGLDDDPLGLFGGKPPAPKAVPPKAVPSPAAPPAVSGPAAPAGAEKAFPQPSLDLDSLIHEPQPARPPFPKAAAAPAGPPPVTAAPRPSSVPGAKESAASRGKKAFSLFKSRAQKAARPLSGALRPVAKKLKVPPSVLAGFLLLVLALAAAGIGSTLNQPAVATVDSIIPLHMVQVTSSQISELDITAYTDLEGKLQSMGFAPVVQMTVPQLPSPNFFDVGMKEDAGVYSEILKVPGQIAPRLSFVTVFTDGVWLSTNAWPGTNQVLDYLDSEFYPNDTPDQLYVQHVQRVEKMKRDKGLQVETLGESRYLAALSDHLRWFLDAKNMQPYQARFSLWH